MTSLPTCSARPLQTRQLSAEPAWRPQVEWGSDLSNVFRSTVPIWGRIEAADRAQIPYGDWVVASGEMRLAQSQGEHLIVLSDAEASSLIDACALLVLATSADAQAALPADMALLLSELFVGLRQACDDSPAVDQGPASV